MTDIKFDKRNYRIHDEKNKRIIRKSLEDCGAGRSVLVDKDNCLIAGNGVYEQAKDLGIPVKIVETDGTELVVVKRTDLSGDDEKRKTLALVDNHASDTSSFDMDMVVEDFSAEILEGFEIDVPDVKNLIEDENDPNIEFDKFGEFKYLNNDNSAWKKIVVHFDTEEDFVKFSQITGLRLTEKTKSVYFPQRERCDIGEVYDQE